MKYPRLPVGHRGQLESKAVSIILQYFPFSCASSLYDYNPIVPAAMEKEAFARLLDDSWESFRDHLLKAYLDDGRLALSTATNQRWFPT